MKNDTRIRLSQLASLILTVFIAQLLLQWFQNDLQWQLVLNFAFSWHTEKFLISLLVLFVPAVWLWGIFGNVRIANVLFLMATTAIGFVTYEKMAQRGEPFYPSDFSMVTEVGFIWDMLTPSIVAFIFLLFFATGTLLWFMGKKKPLRPPAWVRMVMVILTSTGMLYMSYFQSEGHLVRRAYDRTAYWIPYSQKMNYYNNGFVAGFLYNFPSDPMNEPVGYSEAEMEDLIETYRAKAVVINEDRKTGSLDANVIFIMNESFADPTVLKEMKPAYDPIPATRQLAQEAWSGPMLSQGYGGGTANIEFEALTGFSMEPFAANVTTPFTQFLPKVSDFYSVANRLKTEGHHAFAIHPYDTTMYKRVDNYETLGFEAFYFDETMAHTEKIEDNPYISDQATYAETLERMGQTKGLDFAHIVTMQNHTPYAGKYTDPPTYSKTGFSDERVNQYLADLKESDQALADLYQDLKELPEPTVVVFWGDHWPSVFGEDVLKENGTLLLHQTPAIIFSNKDMEPRNWDAISPIYFFNEVLKEVNGRVSPFDAFLLELQEEVPAFEKGMYYSKEDAGFVVSRNELSSKAQELLDAYDWIMYDATTGNRLVENNHFFDVDIK